MAKSAASTVRVYLDQFALSGYVNTFSQDVKQDTPVVTCFSDGGPRRVPGNYDHSHEHNGFFEGTTIVGLDVILAGMVGSASDRYLTNCPAGSSENAIAYDAAVRLSGKPMAAQSGGAVLLHMKSEGSLGMSRGLVLASLTAVGASNRTGRNMGATTAGQIFQVIFRVITFDGTNITLTIEESTDDGVDPYAAISGLTSGALTAVGVVRATTTAATEAYKRAVVAGTFTTALVLVTAGVVAGS